MKWKYSCPHCNEERSIAWAERESRYVCHKDKSKGYLPPTVDAQPNAYVDDHAWPPEMETAVVRIKGNRCTVPGCSKRYETLDHRIPFSKGGKTSVANLFPMCHDHNKSKSDADYSQWLKTRTS